MQQAIRFSADMITVTACESSAASPSSSSSSWMTWTPPATHDCYVGLLEDASFVAMFAAHRSVLAKIPVFATMFKHEDGMKRTAIPHPADGLPIYTVASSVILVAAVEEREYAILALRFFLCHLYSHALATEAAEPPCPCEPSEADFVSGFLLPASCLALSDYLGASDLLQHFVARCEAAIRHRPPHPQALTPTEVTVVWYIVHSGFLPAGRACWLARMVKEVLTPPFQLFDPQLDSRIRNDLELSGVYRQQHTRASTVLNKKDAELEVLHWHRCLCHYRFVSVYMSQTLLGTLVTKAKHETNKRVVRTEGFGCCTCCGVEYSVQVWVGRERAGVTVTAEVPQEKYNCHLGAVIIRSGDALWNYDAGGWFDAQVQEVVEGRLARPVKAHSLAVRTCLAEERFVVSVERGFSVDLLERATEAVVFVTFADADVHRFLSHLHEAEEDDSRETLVEIGESEAFYIYSWRPYVL